MIQKNLPLSKKSAFPPGYLKKKKKSQYDERVQILHGSRLRKTKADSRLANED